MSWTRIENTPTEKASYDSTHTWSHTVTGGKDTLLVVSNAMFDGGDYVTGVTYNGLSLSMAVETTIFTTWKTSIWYLVAPPVGTHDVVATFGGGDTFVLAFVAGATTFSGINQTTPFRSTAYGTVVTPDVSSDQPYVDVPNCVAGDLVYGVCVRNGAILSSVQTEDWLQYNNADNEIGGGEYTTGTTGTVQLNWTMTGTQQWATAGAAFIPSGRRRVFIS